MPQSGVEELTARLIAAIDSQGHVTDIKTVTEVVAKLETMQITAEHLKATRLGKHINTVRRQLVESNKSLAKRMKKLVKSWQQLLQARPTNGLPPPTRTSTPTNPIQASSPVVLQTSTISPGPRELLNSSPVKHDASKLTITSSTPESVEILFSKEETTHNGTTVQAEHVSDPAKNRKKLLKLLSKVKKPVTNVINSTVNGPPPESSVVSAPPSVSTTPHSSIFSNKNFMSLEEISGGGTSNGTPQVSSVPAVKVTNEDECLSLRVSLPRESIPRTPQTSRKTVQKRHKRLKHEVIKSLIVSLPRNLIRLKPQQPIVNPAMNLNPLVENSLIVRLPIDHFSKKTSWQTTTGKKIRNSLLKPTEHAQSISPAEHAQSISPIEHAQTVTPFEHTQMLNSTCVDDISLKVKNNEPKTMEIDDISHSDYTSCTQLSPGNPPKSEDMDWHVVSDKEAPLHYDQPLINGPDLVQSSDETSVMILPYVYIDGVTDEGL